VASLFGCFIVQGTVKRVFW